MAKFYSRKLMDDMVALDADSVFVVLDDGTRFELSFRKSDGIATLTADGTLVVYPRASNVVYLKQDV